MGLIFQREDGKRFSERCLLTRGDHIKSDSEHFRGKVAPTNKMKVKFWEYFPKYNFLSGDVDGFDFQAAIDYCLGSICGPQFSGLKPLKHTKCILSVKLAQVVE